jgi:hypothetical protein
VILAAGTLATPHLLLASNLARLNPAENSVGRYLTRHRNAVVFGVFGRQPNTDHTFDKQIALLDLYEKAGSIQQMTPPGGLVKAYLPRGMREAGARLIAHSSGLLVIAEDQPRRTNGVGIDWVNTDKFGLPTLNVSHTYSRRDEAVAATLICAAKAVMREAGALFTWIHRIESFTHALGTVRMGSDRSTSPLDEFGRYRGLDNLYVVDGSALPRSGALNPSLTIAANALRIGSALAGTAPVKRGRALRTFAPNLTLARAHP